MYAQAHCLVRPMLEALCVYRYTSRYLNLEIQFLLVHLLYVDTSIWTKESL
jgi:hypothetical protein